MNAPFTQYMSRLPGATEAAAGTVLVADGVRHSMRGAVKCLDGNCGGGAKECAFGCLESVGGVLLAKDSIKRLSNRHD